MAAAENLSGQQFAYRGGHRPPSSDADDASVPMHDLTANLPADVYDHPEYYTGYPEHLGRLAPLLRKVRGHPEGRVSVYRSLPAPHQEINTGDWVTPVFDYARQHGRHPTDPSQDMPVVGATVRADQLRTQADDLMEWGYTGPSRTGNIKWRPRQRRKP